MERSNNLSPEWNEVSFYVNHMHSKILVCVDDISSVFHSFISKREQKKSLLIDRGCDVCLPW